MSKVASKDIPISKDKLLKGRVLTIAGSDPSGGAGIQADIKTVSAMEAYCATAITALTVQDTHMVSEVSPVAAPLVRAQMEAVLGDIGADALKSGMLVNEDIVQVLIDVVRKQAKGIPLVVDPVIRSSSGHPLLKPRAVRLIISDLLPLTTLLTPNLAEAAALAQMSGVETVDDMKKAADKLLSFGAQMVLVKGGHLKADHVTDLLVGQDFRAEYTSPRIGGKNNHGTGCTLASAIAAGLAQGMDMKAAVRRAHDYVHRALESAPGFGSGSGPLNHLVKID